MAWRRPSDKPLSEPMMVRLPTHIYVTWPQWVKEDAHFHNELQPAMFTGELLVCVTLIPYLVQRPPQYYVIIPYFGTLTCAQWPNWKTTTVVLYTYIQCYNLFRQNIFSVRFVVIYAIEIWGRKCMVEVWSNIVVTIVMALETNQYHNQFAWGTHQIPLIRNGHNYEPSNFWYKTQLSRK